MSGLVGRWGFSLALLRNGFVGDTGIVGGFVGYLISVKLSVIFCLRKAACDLRYGVTLASARLEVTLKRFLVFMPCVKEDAWCQEELCNIGRAETVKVGGVNAAPLRGCTGRAPAEKAPTKCSRRRYWRIALAWRQRTGPFLRPVAESGAWSARRKSAAQWAFAAREWGRAAAGALRAGRNKWDENAAWEMGGRRESAKKSWVACCSGSYVPGGRKVSPGSGWSRAGFMAAGAASGTARWPGSGARGDGGCGLEMEMRMWRHDGDKAGALAPAFCEPLFRQIVCYKVTPPRHAAVGAMGARWHRDARSIGERARRWPCGADVLPTVAAGRAASTDGEKRGGWRGLKTGR
ncbi:hypothetical protein FGB62_16g234 [Gracilaria domingensis]|nr:hypothetical protein FGB62_16g234 [Gracilaria domingensis]